MIRYGFVTIVAMTCGMLTAGADEPVAKGDSLSQSRPSDALRARGPEGLTTALRSYDAVLRQREALQRDASARTADGAVDEKSTLALDPRIALLDDRLARMSDAIDQIGGQRSCVASRLYWYTDLDAAKAAASASGRPILSLRLLGKLTDEYSCANSRYFRTALYANQEISEYLRDHFVLHWQSVRPVPVVTIDFGDGRTLRRTVTGNSAHYILAGTGQVLDALPGLYGPQPFHEWLTRMRIFNDRYRAAPREHQSDMLRSFHAQRLDEIQRLWHSDIEQLAVDLRAERPEQAVAEETWQAIAKLHRSNVALDVASVALIERELPTAEQAGQIAIAKYIAENPLLRIVRTFEDSMTLDAVRNEYLLHPRIHEQFADGGSITTDVDTLNEWVYAELFLTPGSDPWLGLASDDVYTALDRAGRTEPGMDRIH